MSSYVKLFSSILASTIWAEKTPTKIVWITMLAMANRDGVVEASAPGLAHLARVTHAECEEALRVLESPDRYSRTRDHEGRRIEPIDGGWQILNYELYRDRMSADQRREQDRLRQERRRARLKANPSRDVTDGHDQSHSLTAPSECTSEGTDLSTQKEEPEGFPEFWDAYQKAVEKKAALRAWKKLHPNTELVATILERARAYVRATPDKGFRKNPATWLNGACWDDEIVPREERPGRKGMHETMRTVPKGGTRESADYYGPAIQEL